MGQHPMDQMTIASFMSSKTTATVVIRGGTMCVKMHTTSVKQRVTSLKRAHFLDMLPKMEELFGSPTLLLI